MTTNRYHFLGTFDPPHKGHVHVYHEAIEMIKRIPATLIVGITAQNPQKELPKYTAYERLDMWMDKVSFGDSYRNVQLKYTNFTCEPFNGISASCNSVFLIDTYSTTYDYINAMTPMDAHIHGVPKNHLIIGGDQLFNLHTWHEHENLLELLGSVVVFSRGEKRIEMIKYTHTLLSYYAHKFKFIMQYDYTNISSTQIRNQDNER